MLPVATSWLCTVQIFEQQRSQRIIAVRQQRMEQPAGAQEPGRERQQHWRVPATCHQCSQEPADPQPGWQRFQR